jgi:hypothetical protein
MPRTVTQLDETLIGYGWKSERVAFGRQSWRTDTEDGSAVIEVHVDGDGIVGSLVVYRDHPADEDDGWSEELVKIEIGPPPLEGGRGFRIHRTENEIVKALTELAILLATRVEE